MSKYIFISNRLGFRNWKDSDIDLMMELNQDPDVMRYFPSTQDSKTTKSFIKRMQAEYEAYGYCYFAVELKQKEEFIGFIGISNQDYGEVLGKFTDIGWRLKKAAWGMGYATEGAKQNLLFAREQLKLKEIFAVAPKINTPSLAVMNKIGMQMVKEFTHPKLIEYPSLKQCLLYQINL